MKKEGSELIVWSDKFLCGVSVIDEQHKILFNLINNLLMNVTGNQETERPYFNMVINNILKYIKIHLATEEKYLYAAKFPLYAHHKRAHKTFLITLYDVINDYKTGKIQNLAIITNYFKNWALSHVAIMDRAYFDFFKEIASRDGVAKQDLR